MGDEDRGKEMAATTERSVSVPREQDRPTGDEVTTPSLRSGNSLDDASQPGPRGGGPDGFVGAEQERPRAASAGPVAEDEVTEWIGTAGRSLEAATPPVAAGPASAAAPDAEPESASWLGARLAALIVIAGLVIGSLAVVAVRHLTGTRASDAVARRRGGGPRRRWLPGSPSR